MSEQLPPEEEQQELEDEQLSGTLLGGLADSLRRLGQGFGGVASVIVLVGVVALVLGMVIFAFFEDLKLYSYIVMGVGGLLLLFSLIISFPTVSEAVTGRRGRYTTNTTLMIAAFIGIVAVGNFLAIEIAARMDVTATKQFDLAPRTRSLLGDLQGDVYARAFFPESNIQPNPNLDAFRGQMDDILREFSKRSGKFRLRIHRPGHRAGHSHGIRSDPSAHDSVRGEGLRPTPSGAPKHDLGNLLGEGPGAHRAKSCHRTVDSDRAGPEAGLLLDWGTGNAS